MNEQAVLRMNLRELRKEAGLSVGYVAEHAGIAHSIFARIEKGGIPNLANALRLAKFLETPVEEIWGLEE